MLSEALSTTNAPWPHLLCCPRRPARRWPSSWVKASEPALQEMMTETLTASGWRVSRPNVHVPVPGEQLDEGDADEDAQGAAAAWLEALPEPLQPKALSVKARRKFCGVEKGPVMSGDGKVIENMTLRILKSVKVAVEDLNLLFTASGGRDASTAQGEMRSR
jgi:hypothetical protein